LQKPQPIERVSSPTDSVLLYFILPLWPAAGFADWLCHHASQIESTSGAKESLIHLLMFAEVGVALLAGLFLQINTGVRSWAWEPKPRVTNSLGTVRKVNFRYRRDVARFDLRASPRDSNRWMSRWSMRIVRSNIG
jgi:hypothetical protein